MRFSIRSVHHYATSGLHISAVPDKKQSFGILAKYVAGGVDFKYLGRVDFRPSVLTELMHPFDLREHPHRRLNPLTMEWVLVSPHRTQRPWQGQVEKLLRESTPTYDPSCYMCPGNTRANGSRNPDYLGTFVFDNDYSALLPDTPRGGLAQSDIGDHDEGFDSLVVAQSEQGICRVVSFSQRHDLTISQMDGSDIRKVVDVWADQYRELGALPFVNHVQIFENRGAMMGCSNPHPHCQIWASESLPNEPTKESDSFQRLPQGQGISACSATTSLWNKNRAAAIVVENNISRWLCAFWAVWPFETMIIGSVTPARSMNWARRSATDWPISCSD